MASARPRSAPDGPARGERPFRSAPDRPARGERPFRSAPDGPARGAESGVFHVVHRSIERTKRAFLHAAFEKLAMFVANIISHGATAFLHGILCAHKALELISAHSLEINVPVYHAPCKIDVMVGIPLDRKMPTVYLSPGGDSSPFGGIEVTPADNEHESRRAVAAAMWFDEDDHRRALVAEVDLSEVAEVTEPGDRAAAMRDWAEQQLVPNLREHCEDNDLELVFVYDPVTGIGAWMRLSTSERHWCIVLNQDSRNNMLTAKIVRLV